MDRERRVLQHHHGRRPRDRALPSSSVATSPKDEPWCCSSPPPTSSWEPCSWSPSGDSGRAHLRPGSPPSHPARPHAHLNTAFLPVAGPPRSPPIRHEPTWANQGCAHRVRHERATRRFPRVNVGGRRYHRLMAQCTAPVYGHRSSAAAANCPRCGGRSGYRSSSSSYSGSTSYGGVRGSTYGSALFGGSRSRRTRAGRSVSYSPSETAGSCAIR